MEWEANFLIWLQQFRSPLMDTVWTYLSYPGLAVLFIPLVVCLIKKKDRIMGVMMLMTGVPSFVAFGVILKAIIHRARPYESWPAIIPVLFPIDASFPSGHTLISFLLAFFYFKCMPKKIGIPALILAALIAFSRLMLGVHYPTDILAGFLIAWVSVEIGIRFVLPWLQEKKERWTWL